MERLKQQGKGSQTAVAQQPPSALPAKGGGKGGKGGKSGGKGKPDPKKKPGKPSGSQDKSQKQRPFFAKKGACKKGDSCDMSHTLAAAVSTGGNLPAGWGAPSGAAMTNPFATFSIVVAQQGLSVTDQKGNAGKVYATEPRPNAPMKGHPFTELDQLPKDWWKVVQNEKGGYQYKTVTKILGTCVETMLDGGAGSNHVTEELIVSILNKAASLGLNPEDPKFPIIQFEKWVYQEFVHGIASGSPVPLKGAVVLRVRLQEGTDPAKCTDGPEIFLRCKIAAKGTSDWHGLIIGGRALDCEARRGLGFRPGPKAHIFDSLGVQMPRCEDLSAERKDRAYPFESVISSLDSGLTGSHEPGQPAGRSLLVYDGEEEVFLLPGEGALIPVEAEDRLCDVSLSEAALPIEGAVEAVPGVWPTGTTKGMLLVAARQEAVTIEKGVPVGELRAGAVSSGICECGAVDTILEGPVKGSALGMPSSLPGQTCQVCGKSGKFRTPHPQGLPPKNRKVSKTARSWGYGLLALVTSVLSGIGSTAMLSFSADLKDKDSWFTFPGGIVRAHYEPRDSLYDPEGSDFPGLIAELSGRRVTCALCQDGRTITIEDDWRSSPSREGFDEAWTGETRFFWQSGRTDLGSREWRSTRTEPVFHIVEVPGGIERMAEQAPTDAYYDEPRADLRNRFPGADRHLLDHLTSLEGFLDKSILCGFSYGVAKAELCRTGGKLLGHVIGRDGSSPDPERSQAVREFAPLKGKLHVQQFLGSANWLRTYLPSEFGHCAKVLTAYQKPEAVFPPEGLGAGNTEGCKAVRAIKKMLEQAIGIAVFDEASAIDGSCPLEQVADASGYAVGGTVLQMTRDLSRMKVLLTHSRSLTPPQQAWPPLVQEAYAQLEVKRATRKMFGSVRTLCWTDHANLTRAQHIDIGSDVKLVRWIAEILADGSEIRSLSGRSAKLGDGFSRNPKDRDELLQARTKDLQGLSGHLKGFNLEEYLGEGTEDPNVPVAWAIVDDVLPEPSGDYGDSRGHAGGLVAGPSGSSRVSRCYAGTPEAGLEGHPVKVLVLADYEELGRTALEVQKIQKIFEHSMPGCTVGARTSYGAFEDDDGRSSHLDGATASLKGDRQTKRARVDLLTSCAKALRSIGAYLPDFVVGQGQGGIIAGMLRFPLVVEVTLQARNLQRKEIQFVVSGWAKIRAFWSVNPRMWRTHSGMELLKLACPEVGKAFPVEPLRAYGVVTRGPNLEGVRQVLEVLQAGEVKDIASVNLSSLMREPPVEVFEHNGQCSCGKRAYVFARCITCIEKEAADDMRASAEALEEATAETLPEAELLADEMLLCDDVPAPIRSYTFRCSGIIAWVQAWIAALMPSGFHEIPGGFGQVRIRTWKVGTRFQGQSAFEKPWKYGAVWCVQEDQSVCAIRSCCQLDASGPCSPSWTLDSVQWLNHMVLVDDVCSKIWRDQKTQMYWPASFGRLISLLGKVTKVVKWNDGDGKASIGHRRDLSNQKVLVAFCQPESGGYWYEHKIGKKIKVKEDKFYPIVAFIGETWKSRVVVEVRSKNWVSVQWEESREEVDGRENAGRVDVSRSDRGCEDHIAAGFPDPEIEDFPPTRKELVEDARLHAGLAEFTVTGSLRSLWYDAQRKDESLAGHFRRTGDPFRLGEDGLLEREVSLVTGDKIWVPVIPNGIVGVNGLTFRKGCFDQAHYGATGGHRSAERTLQVLARSVWWPSMAEDVKRWTSQCLACLKARSKPTKVTARSMKCCADACWQEVSVDCEGPSREDRWGYRYTLTYLDCLSHAVLIEPMRALTHAEVRRSFAKCMFRSRTIPTLVRSDRGTEFKNAMMAEFCALMGVQQRFSMAMRPCELGANERMHQEVQKTLGIILKELVRGEGDEWSELLPLVEYLLDTSPGPHGYCPRDLERAWSLGLGLEKDLIREAMKFEPMSEWSRRQFGQFAAAARQVRRHWEKSSEARAKLANRYRRTLELRPGDRVVWQAPTSRPEGRVPWRRGLSGPWEVVSVRGNKLTLRSVPGLTDKDRQGPFEAHAEDCVLVPGDVEDRSPSVELELAEDPPDAAHSLGQRMTGQGEQYEFVMQRRGRQFVLRIGDVVAYTRGARICKLGRVAQVSVAEGTVSVHMYRPVVGSLRVKWVLAYLDEHGEVSADGTKASMDQVRLKEIVTKAEISREGVLAASTSRKLDKAGYRLHEEVVGLVSVEAEVSCIGKDFEQRGVWPSEVVYSLGPPGPAGDLYKWLVQSRRATKVVFLEVYTGSASLTCAARKRDFQAAPPIDEQYPSYGRSWDLTQKLDQTLFMCLLEWLEPLLVHLGFPSKPSASCKEGSFQTLSDHAVGTLRFQNGKGRLATLEGHVNSPVFLTSGFVSEFGPLGKPKKPWNVVRVDQCQYGPEYLLEGSAIVNGEKGQLWVSNYDLSEFSMRCRNSDTLASSNHKHQRPVTRVADGILPVRSYAASCGGAYWHSAKREFLKRGLKFKGLEPLSERCVPSAAAPGVGSVGARHLAVPVHAASGGVSADAREMTAEPVPDQDVNVGPEISPRSRDLLEKEIADLHVKMVKVWKDRAERHDWDQIKADLSVYRLSGETVEADPRRTEAYRAQVLEGLGFSLEEGKRRTDLTDQDLLACRDVLARKAAAFWIEGTPRTTVRMVAHDCVPTGPPVSLQPHALKGEAAAWVDEKLEEEVQRGQLVRGTSAWGSPPFPTKDMPAHKRPRKRRLVVDYRRVNARVLRST